MIGPFCTTSCHRVCLGATSPGINKISIVHGGMAGVMGGGGYTSPRARFPLPLRWQPLCGDWSGAAATRGRPDSVAMAATAGAVPCHDGGVGRPAGTPPHHRGHGHHCRSLEREHGVCQLVVAWMAHTPPRQRQECSTPVGGARTIAATAVAQSLCEWQAHAQCR